MRVLAVVDKNGAREGAVAQAQSLIDVKSWVSALPTFGKPAEEISLTKRLNSRTPLGKLSSPPFNLRLAKWKGISVRSSRLQIALLVFLVPSAALLNAATVHRTLILSRHDYQLTPGARVQIGP